MENSQQLGIIIYVVTIYKVLYKLSLQCKHKDNIILCTLVKSKMSTLFSVMTTNRDPSWDGDVVLFFLVKDDCCNNEGIRCSYYWSELNQT